MADYDIINTFLVDIWGRINKIEERSLTTGLNADISITEIHIIEKIGNFPARRMSELARMLGVTLATLTVACDKLEGKDLIIRSRDTQDKRIVNITLTARGQAVFEYHKQFHRRMIEAALEDLTPEETSVLAESLQKLQRFFLAQGMT